MFDILKEKQAVAALSVTMLITLGVSSIVPVLPRLAREFGVTSVEASLLLTIFTVPGLLALPLAGFLADRYGRKAVLIPCLVLFIASGLGCMFAQSFSTLLALRLIQGVSASPLSMLGNSIIGDNYSGPKLLLMMSYSGAMVNISTALFPSLSGSLAAIHWRLIFALPLLAVISLIVCSKQQFAKPGARVHLKDYAKNSWQAISNKKILFLMGLGIGNLLLMFGPILTCFPLMADLKHNAPPHVIGYIQSSLSIGAVLGSIFVGRVATKGRIRTILLSGQVLFVFSLASLPLISSLWLYPVSIIVFGFSMGLSATVVMTMLVSSASAEQRSAVLSAFSMCICLGQTISPILFSAIAHYSHADNAMWAGAGLGVFMVIATVILFKGNPANAAK